MIKFISKITIAIFLSAFLSLNLLSKEYSKVPIFVGLKFGSFKIYPRIETSKSVNSKHLVRQKMDFSCGSAATATIYNYYLNDPLTEDQVINGLFKFGNKMKIVQNKGFSLLDIKRLSNALGYKVNGYKLDLDSLAEIGKPAIVTITIGNYKHFVVFRGLYKGRVFIADPALGNTILPRDEFDKIWYKHIALIIEQRRYGVNKLAITKEDMKWVGDMILRNYIFRYDLPYFRSFLDH